jgi:hypothetical protein
MSFSAPLQHELKMEASRLRVAELWAKLHPSRESLAFDQGRRDRLNGAGCLSANGSYLDGWYSVKGSK